MSYANIASHNIPAGDHGAKPDPNLADGHFKGEHEAHNEADHKINILPAGSDPEHPDIHPSSHVAPPDPVHITPTTAPGPHVSEVAPKPTPAPHKGDVHIPESGAQFEKEHPKATANAKKAEKKVGEAAETVKEDAEEAEEKVEEVAAEAKEKGKKVASNVEKKTKEVAKDVEKKTKEVAKDVEKKSKELAKDAKAEFNAAEQRLGPYWEKTKDVVLRPGTLGGLMGVANVGLLGTLGYFAYTRKDQPWDRRVVSSAVIGTLALFGAEGYVAESYLNTPEGREEAERAKREGSKAYLQAKEVVLRPGVFGGLAGALNVAVLGTVGYFSYKHWNHPWDRQTVSAVSIGLLALSGIEGVIGKKYKDEELPKRR